MPVTVVNPQCGFARNQSEAEYPRLWNGLTGLWSTAINPRGGTILRDWSRKQNHGTLTNMDPSTDWATSGGYAALDFDGTNDYVNCGTPAALTSMTISCWVVPTSFAAYRNIVGKASNSPVLGSVRNYSIDLEITTGKVRWIFTQGSDVYRVVTSATGLTLSTLTHICCTYVSGYSAVYLNGKLDASSASFTGSPDSSNGPLLIGDLVTTSVLPYVGTIQEVAIYDRALTAGAVSDLYQLRPGGIFTPRRRRVYAAAEAPAAQSNAGFWMALMGGTA